jgi:HAD superfamily hydrolase (TIGR01549 family)
MKETSRVGRVTRSGRTRRPRAAEVDTPSEGRVGRSSPRRWIDGGVTTVTFDLWHTLVYLDPREEDLYMEAQVDIASRALAASPSKPGFLPRSVIELARDFQRVFAEAVIEAGEGRTVTPTEQLRRAGRLTGRIPDAGRYLAELDRRVSRTPFRRAPGAIELLRGLAEDGHQLGLISNTIGERGITLRPILRSLELDQCFKTRIFSDEWPWAKPAPEIFLEALRQLGGTPERTVHVGDGWSDIEGARRAGLRAGILFTGLQSYGERYRTLFVRPRTTAAAARYTVNRLEVIRPLIGKLLPVRQNPDFR